MNQTPPEGEQQQPEKPSVKRARNIQKYIEMLAECIANGDKLVPLWRNSFILSGTFTRETVSRWVYEGRFPLIRIGRRRYTSNKVLAQWVLDGQKDRDVFPLDYTKTVPGLSWKWKGDYRRARELTNERRAEAGLPPLSPWEPLPPMDAVEQQPDPVPETPEPQPEPMVKKEIIVEDLMPSDEDLYSDPG